MPVLDDRASAINIHGISPSVAEYFRKWREHEVLCIMSYENV